MHSKRNSILRGAVCLLLCALMAGCGAPGPVPSPSETPPESASANPPDAEDGVATIRWMVRHEGNLFPKDYKGVVDALNNRSADAGFALELTPVHAAQYEKAVYTLLASESAEYSIVNIDTGMNLYGMFLSGQLAEIGELLPLFPALSQTVPAHLYDILRTKGGVYGIPTENRQSAVRRRDGLIYLSNAQWTGAPQTPSQLLDWAVSYHAQTGGVLLCQEGMEETGAPRFLHRGYEQWPFTMDADEYFIFDMQGNMEIYMESAVFERDSELMYALRQSGALFPSGQTPAPPIGGALGVEAPGVVQNPQEYTPWQMAPEKPDVEETGRMAHVFPAQKDALPALRYLDWLYHDRTNYALIAYGIEGEHYRYDPGLPVPYLPEYAEQNGRPAPKFPLMHAITHQHLPEYTQEYLDSLTQSEREGAGSLAIPPSLGFRFDTSAPQLQRQFQGVFEVFVKYDFPGMRDGRIPSDDLDEMIQAAKQAGLDDLYSECKRQYAEFLNLKGFSLPEAE